MIALILFAGLAFWTGLTFFGVRKNLEQNPDGPAANGLRRLSDLSPVGLTIPGLAGIGIGVLVTVFQLGRIEAGTSVIGPLGALGWLCAVAGAAMLASRGHVD